METADMSYVFLSPCSGLMDKNAFIKCYLLFLFYFYYAAFFLIDVINDIFSKFSYVHHFFFVCPDVRYFRKGNMMKVIKRLFDASTLRDQIGT